MAAKRKWIKARVEQLLRDEWQSCCVVTDSDGDFPFRNASSACWVAVDRHRPFGVRVFAYAAIGLKPSARLLRELNEMQVAAHCATIALCDDRVVVSYVMSPYGLTRRSLHAALRAVAGVAGDVGPLLAAMFDGQTPFPADETVDEDAA